MINFIRWLHSFFFVFMLLSSCGSSDKNSERDKKRDQIRNYALSKEKELSDITGNYFGSLFSDGVELQKIHLLLTIREDVSDSETSIDPTRIPRLAGYMRLAYVSDNESDSYISYSIIKGDYDSKLNSVTLELKNSQYGLLTLDLSDSEEKLSGKWLSSENSSHGEINLIRLNEDNMGLSSNFIPSSLNTEFTGYLSRNKTGSYHLSKLIFQTQKNDNDSLIMAASLLFYNGSWSDSEYQKFTFSTVNFNALTGGITMIDDSSTISLNGSLRDHNLRGTWSTSYSGNSGEFLLNSRSFAKPDESLQQEPSISKTYFGKIIYTENNQSHFPENISISLSMGEDAEAPLKSSLNGKVRFYTGSYGSQEYLEVPFSDIDYNVFNRALIIRTENPYQMTFSATLEKNLISGDFHYGSPGKIGEIKLNDSYENSGMMDMQGQYQAVFRWNDIKAYQYGNFQIFTSYDNGLKISGDLKMIFGPSHSVEYLSYKFENIEFNPESGILTISSPDTEVYLKVRYDNGSLHGDWFSHTRGNIGHVCMSQSKIPEIPDGFSLLSGIGGSYRGKIINKNESTSLPEKTLLNIAASRNTESKDGLLLQGSIRFYLGSFDSHEYMEYTFSNISYNFYTRELNATTIKENLLIQGFMQNGIFSGSISHNGFGTIGTIEVKI
ncbi:MAG: hypothetical protein H6618_07935 [Deltaproteobacteria bacterium]|nr:hypothetical protein [Deltaproteobacteria bacterium]